MSSGSQQVEFSARAGLAEVRLNRPEALHALTLEMVEAIDVELARWSEDVAVKSVIIRAAGSDAFCGGVDQRAIYEALASGDRDYGRRFYRRFYQLLYRIARYPKPIAAVMHGVTMGGGLALAMHCAIRIVTRQSYCAVPDCRIGFFPDGGAAHYLARSPAPTAMFLGLTGVALRARGMIQAGLATHLVPESQVELVTPLLVGTLAVEPPPSPLADIERHVDAVFGLGSLEEILGILSVRSGEWAKRTLEQLRPLSPTSLAVTFRHLRAARGQPLETVLATDYRLTQRFLDGHDFREGVRAFILDRDERPRWQPADLKAVSQATLDGLFAPLAGIPEWATAD